MGPLIIVSVVMWTLIVERLAEYRRLSGNALGEILTSRFESRHSGNAKLDQEILQELALCLRRSLENRLAIIGVLAAVAPLLGLLGTVLGMVETFDVISLFGTGNARAMAGGISVALITTQTGLLVAIPGMLMSNRLARISRDLKTRLDETVARMIIQVSDGLPVTARAVSEYMENAEGKK
ncbi:MAG: MotA/TolQ/ExbB proton channel family protein [bacterium]|nr:MotA/TolQ/ExbB proton channel family protein [bacterium]